MGFNFTQVSEAGCGAAWGSAVQQKTLPEGKVEKKEPWERGGTFPMFVIYAGVCVCVCVCMCVCAGPEDNLGYQSSVAVHFILLRQALSLVWTLPSWLS